MPSINLDAPWGKPLKDSWAECLLTAHISTSVNSRPSDGTGNYLLPNANCKALNSIFLLALKSLSLTVPQSLQT